MISLWFRTYGQRTDDDGRDGGANGRTEDDDDGEDGTRRDTTGRTHRGRTTTTGRTDGQRTDDDGTDGRTEDEDRDN